MYSLGDSLIEHIRHGRTPGEIDEPARKRLVAEQESLRDRMPSLFERFEEPILLLDEYARTGMTLEHTRIALEYMGAKKVYKAALLTKSQLDRDDIISGGVIDHEHWPTWAKRRGQILADVRSPMPEIREDAKLQ